ncbi:MAG TPA: preprotein translocase subunit SecE [Rubellimicrobium sp.]|jgi:preprotein translocase subunit SecE|nr:preprotein translocase subunit SecE [Rubellimicrobium sp.]
MATPVAPVRQEPLPRRVALFYHDVLAEMRKVTWPDRAQLQDATIKIIIFVLALGAVIGLLDLALQFVLVQLPALLLGR